LSCSYLTGHEIDLLDDDNIFLWMSFIINHWH